jgi:hypothetical protein
MRTLGRLAPMCTVFWSALAGAQAPSAPPPAPASRQPTPRQPAPPAPLPPPSRAPLEPPVSGGVTDVRAPDTTAESPPPVDQGPDTLPSIDEDTEPTLPPPRRVVRRAKADRPLPPVRVDRRLALLGELGWNGLAGFGAIVSYHAHPQLTFDLGVGLAIVGGKLGLRTRFNFLDGPVSPFVGVGFMGATGFDAPTRDIAAQDDDSDLNIELRPSAFLQAVAGIDWTSRDGFTLVGALGYAWLLTGDNVVIVTGEPTADERQGLDIAFGSSIVVSIAIGYSFR